MKSVALLATFCFLNLLNAEEDFSKFLKKIEENAQSSVYYSQGLEWSKKHLQEKILEDVKINALSPEKLDSLAKGKCSTVSSAELSTDLYVFLSFAVPEVTWVELSKEMEKIGGVIVLKGIPDNSFIELSKRFQKLFQLGVKAPIQINPQLFERYGINVSPTFVVVDTDKYDKISGNISLNYALEALAKEGETDKAKEISKRRGVL